MYRERLWPAAWVWMASLLFALMCGLVVAKASWTGAFLAMFAAAAVTCWLLVISTPLVAVEGDTFVAGRARILVSLLGEVDVLDTEQMYDARGPGLDARAYLCIRGWLPEGVRVWLQDPDDPTPHWIVSSRRPAALAAALAAARRPA